MVPSIPPPRFIREAYEERPLEGSSDAMRGFPYLRKAHCMFGWDWGPRLPDAGIWREVELMAFDTARAGWGIHYAEARGRPGFPCPYRWM